MRENVSNEAKALIREVLERMVVPLLLAAEAAGEGGGAGAASAPPGGGMPQYDSQMADNLLALPHAAFMQVGVEWRDRFCCTGVYQGLGCRRPVLVTVLSVSGVVGWRHCVLVCYKVSSRPPAE